MTHHTTLLAHDDIGEPGRCVVLLPGAGDVRSEHRFLGAALAAAGYRVVAVDLPGHGDSPIFDSYGVEETAGSLLDLLDYLDAGPVSVVACSFSPAAAVWAATDRPGAIERMVMISPHLETAEGLRYRILRASVSALLRGPWAGSMWTKQVRSWYPSGTPADLDVELEKLRIMFSDPARRRAARDTLTAHRRGLQPRIARLDTPAMVVFGSADSHFSDPGAEAEAISAATNATITMIEGAGHYPHAERPDETAAAVLDFLGR